MHLHINVAINVQETTKLTEIELPLFYQLILARDFPASVTAHFSSHMAAR